MRRHGPPSEVGRLVAPIVALLDRAWHNMHWWIGAMAVLYALSGITVVRAGEVAIVLRWGRLVGATPALQEHGPGLLFALPRPIDQVVRVPVKRISELPISTLAFTGEPRESEDEDDQPAETTSDTLDPLTTGYALTGDHNIVQVDLIARYRVRDAALWALYGPRAEDVLRVEVTAAMVRSLGEMGVDSVLSDGRKTLVATAMARTQAGLDAVRAGLELSALELQRLGPPPALSSDFNAVQSAFIGAETAKNSALASAATDVPEAQMQVDAMLQSARATAAADLARAQGESDAFRALAREYHANPAVVRERLYRDAVERAISSAASVQWVPPPVGDHYNGFRVIVTPPGGGNPDDRDR